MARQINRTSNILWVLFYQKKTVSENIGSIPRKACGARVYILNQHSGDDRRQRYDNIGNTIVMTENFLCVPFCAPARKYDLKLSCVPFCAVCPYFFPWLEYCHNLLVHYFGVLCNCRFRHSNQFLWNKTTDNYQLWLTNVYLQNEWLEIAAAKWM